MKHLTPLAFCLAISIAAVVTMVTTSPQSAAVGAEGAGIRLEAGAAAVDISPKQLPAIRNGGFLQATYDRVADPLYARALALKSGGETLAICVVDSCMLPTDVCSDIKAAVTKQVDGLPANRILISSTHTHSAPSAMAMCLGTRKDEAYTAQMIPQVAQAIVEAHAALRPAKAGWSQVDAPEFTNCRRWIRRSDKMAVDPFGERSILAMMHPGYENSEFVGPSGPIDPQLSLLSVVSAEDDAQPIALLANYSMHYFGAGGGFSADYFGDLARLLEEGAGGGVGIVSQGTSGDLHWMDYSKPKREGYSREQYSQGLAEVALTAWRTIEHRPDIDLKMAETRLPLRRRTPSPERLEWAKPINAQRGDAVPKSKEEVYAEQAQWIHENPETELILQAIRIGGLGITAIPNEVYGITGLKLKAQSPLAATFNIELANGAEGYIPPPEQHRLGGYTTWPARTAGLEETTEPKIVEALSGLLEEVAGKPRRAFKDAGDAPYAVAVIKDEPLAYWRLNDLTGPEPREAVGREGTIARFENGVAYGLPGVPREGGGISTPPDETSPFNGKQVNRAAHFAGGRLRAGKPELGRRYSVEFWFWNGFPADARPVTGYLFSLGEDGDRKALGEHLGIGGTSADTDQGKLFFYTGNQVGQVIRGKTPLAFRDWHHVVVVRDRDQLTVYLDGKVEIDEPSVKWTFLPESADEEVFFGGRSDGMFGLEGKMDEVALYASALTAEQVAAHFAAAERTPPKPPGPKLTSQPLSPDEGLKALQLADGFEARIVAHEPQVIDPVAFDWDVRGRLWVVEMADYPLGLDNEGASGGRVRLLEDRDGDGNYETSTLFAEGLNFPNGIITWREGIIITAAPDILYLEDSNGDGKADKRDVLCTGLSEGNQQLRANGLRWGLDNWIYVAAGGHHGKYGADTKLRSSKTGKETLVGSRDFRIRPDTGEIEPQSGPTQFGRNRDDWGHWFGTQNSHPLWHYVLPDHYLQRNPHLAAPEGRVQLPGGSNPQVYAASPPEKRYHSFQQSGRYTSACGGMIYRDSVLFPAGETRAFTCEPFHNLVQQLKLEPDKTTFSAQRVPGTEKEDAPDFFASTDRWCRPVMIRTGPDGALWVADMYRYMIEHPQFLPAEGKEELLPHYRIGEDRGRIYRITQGAETSEHPDTVPKLGDLETGEIIAQLKSSNGWVRDKAHQVLLWRAPLDNTAIQSLESLAGAAPLPESRVQVLGVLEGLGELRAEVLVPALADEHPGVRENAVRLAEAFAENPAVINAATRLASDPDAKVRLQLAFTLGQWPGAEAGETLAALLSENTDGAGEDDSFITIAALSSALPHLEPLAKSATGETRDALLPMALAAGNRAALADLLAPAFDFAGAGGAPATERWRLFGILLDELAARKQTLGVLQNAGTGDDALSGLLKQTPQLIGEAKARLNAEAPPAESLAAATLLAKDAASRELGLTFFEERLTTSAKDGPETWQPTLAAFAATGAKSVPDTILKLWPGLTPQQRGAALDVLMRRAAWARRVLQAAESGTEVRITDFDATRRMPLLNHPDKAIKKQAEALFAGNGSAPARTSIVESYLPALKRKGDAKAGHEVYVRVCAACHQHGESEGRAVGPHLNSVAAHEPEKLLANILDPNLDIQPGYHAYTATLKSGEQLFGLLASESGAALTFKLPDGSERNLRRSDVSALKSTGVSLMPEGLEAVITPEEMADLIAFLRANPAAGN